MSDKQYNKPPELAQLNVVKFYTKTCDACPAQWQGLLSDANTFYVRYRFGNLTCHIPYPTTYEQYQAPVYQKTIGDDLDGSMTTFEMQAHLSSILDFTIAEWVIEDI